MTKLDSRLQQALEQIEAGAEPAAAIAAVSAGLDAPQAAELAELIRLAVALREMPAPAPVRMGLPTSVINAARDLRVAQTRPPRWYERLRLRELASQAYVIGFGVLMLAIFAGVFIVPEVREMITGQPTATVIIDASATPDTPTARAPSTITVANTSTPESTVEPTLALPPPLFEIPLSSPIITHGSETARDWDGLFTDPGAVITIDGRLVMFRNGSLQSLWPTQYMTGLHESETGLTWQPMDSPVFKSVDVPFSNIAAMVTGAVTEPGGSVSIYFYTHTALTPEYDISYIGRAHASSLEGPYVAGETPVLRPGSKGMWDEFAVRHPSVIRTANGYLMAYTGINVGGERTIGIATSTDGVTWTKYDDPATGGAYAESDPVLMPEAGAWDSKYLFDPSIVETQNGLVMAYRGGPGLSSYKNLIGLAQSADGLTWTRYERNPVFDASALNSNASLGHVTMAYFNNALHLYMEIFVPPARGSNIWVAVYKGDLP